MSKGGGTPAATTQTTTSEFPTELRPYITDILERAKGQAEREEEQGYQAYTGPRIAEFEPEQLASQQAIREFAGRGVAASPALSSAQTYYTPALGLTLGQTEQFGAPQASQYMSPYQQAVIDVEKREAIRQFQPVQQGIGAQATRAGAFGGSRQAILEAEAGRNLQQQLGDIQTRGLQSAYDRAQSAFEAQKARERGAAGSLAQMGAALPAQALKEIGALQALGSERQQMAQRALDLGYSQFREEQMFPTRSLQEYQSIIRGFPFTPSTYSTSSYIAPPASLAQNVLGIGTGIAGLAGAFGGFKEGGVVRRQQGSTVAPRPTITGMDEGSISESMQAQKAWDEQYGTTHNPDGTVKEGVTITEDIDLTPKPKTFTVSEDGQVPPRPTITGMDEGSISESMAEQAAWDEQFGDTHTESGTPKTKEEATVDPSKKVSPSTSGDTTKGDSDTSLDDINNLLSKGKNNRLTNLEDLLESQLKDIQSRDVLTPELKALQSEYATMLADLPKKEKERKEELKKQKYLQLAEFGRSLLGADTTKGLLAQVAQAGEKPLQELGRITGEEGELSDKQRAERLGLMGKQAELSQAAQTAERQKTADITSISKSLTDIQTARNEAQGIDSQIPESVVAGILSRSSVGAFVDDATVAPQIQSVISEALGTIEQELISGNLADNNFAVRNRIQEILPPMLEALNTESVAGKSTSGSGDVASDTLNDLYQ